MSIWTPDYFRLFICHVSSQKETAQQLKKVLSLYNISCFVAHTDIEPTRAWQDEIEEALRTMDALAAILTPDFHASKWTDQEVGFAMGKGITVVSLRHGEDPYGFIGKYQGYPIGRKNYTEIASDLVAILLKNSATCLPMAQALVKRLEESSCWDSSKRTMTMLEQCVQFDDDLLVRMHNAIEGNSQVKDAWGVPDRIDELVTKFTRKEEI